MRTASSSTPSRSSTSPAAGDWLQLLRCVGRRGELITETIAVSNMITETIAVSNIPRAQHFAARLADLGCRFALDDFGAGFGSFYYLKHLPFDYLKIDGEFVRHSAVDTTDQLVIQAVVDIARGLGKRTIAEHVGDRETAALLRRMGVDHAQGFHLGRARAAGGLAAGGGGRGPDLGPAGAQRVVEVGAIGQAGLAQLRAGGVDAGAASGLARLDRLQVRRQPLTGGVAILVAEQRLVGLALARDERLAGEVERVRGLELLVAAARRLVEEALDVLSDREAAAVDRVVQPALVVRRVVRIPGVVR